MTSSDTSGDQVRDRSTNDPEEMGGAIPALAPTTWVHRGRRPGRTGSDAGMGGLGGTGDPRE
jgi:hypothetical protein